MYLVMYAMPSLGSHFSARHRGRRQTRYWSWREKGDLVGVTLYEKAGVDEHGLEKYNCRRGTNKVEGGPHGNIYRKFGAPHGMYNIHLTPNLNNSGFLQLHRAWRLTP